jgi:hypothetical protein
VTELPLQWRARRRIVSWLRLRGRCDNCGAGGYVEFEECPSCRWRLLARGGLNLVRELHIDYPYWLWLTISQRLEDQELTRLLSESPGVERLRTHSLVSTPRWFPAQYSCVSLTGKHDFEEMPPRLEEIAEAVTAAVERLLKLRPRRISVSLEPRTTLRPRGEKRRVSSSELLALIRDAALEPQTQYVADARRP